MDFKCLHTFQDSTKNRNYYIDTLTNKKKIDNQKNKANFITRSSAGTEQTKYKNQEKQYVKKGYDPAKPGFIVSKTFMEQIKEMPFSFPEMHSKYFERRHPAPIFNNDTILLHDSAAIAYEKYMLFSNSSNTNSKLGINNDLKADWLLGVLLLMLVLLTWVKLFYNKYLSQIVQSLINYQLSFKLFRDRNVLYTRMSFILNLIFVLVTGLFLHFVDKYYGIKLFEYSRFISFLLYSGMVLLFSFVQHIILTFTGYLFLLQKEMAEYIHNIFVSYKNIGLFLLPLIIGLSYMSKILTKPLIISGISIIILLYAWRFLRGIKIIVKKDIFYFYLILYFCTLEILPVLLLYKYFRSIMYTGSS